MVSYQMPIPKNVVAAEVAILPPVQWSVIVDEGVETVGAGVVIADPQSHGENVSDISVADKIDDGVVHLQRLGCGHDLGHLVGVQTAGVQHLMGLVGIHGHAGFGQHVLAC